MTLSLCMIVRDEEERLGRCLESMRGLVDEIVVVDTGSTDRTVEVARASKAQVYLFTWSDDFAGARNAALRHARGDWILQLDADERLAPGSAESVRKLTVAPPAGPVGFILTQRNTGVQAGRWFGNDCPCVRLFSRHPRVAYHRPVHEEVTHLDGDELLPRVPASDIVIEHGGHTDDLLAAGRKLDRNIRILRKAVQGWPDDAYYWFLLGREISFVGHDEDAWEAVSTSLRLTSQRRPGPWASDLSALAIGCLLRLGRPEEAIAIGQRVPLETAFPNLLCNLGAAYQAMGRWPEGRDVFRQAIAAAARPWPANVVDLAARTWLPHAGLAACHWQLGARAAATGSYVRALDALLSCTGLEEAARALGRGDITGVVEALLPRPELVQGILLLADWLESAGLRRLAADALARWIERYPNSGDLRRRWERLRTSL